MELNNTLSESERRQKNYYNRIASTYDRHFASENSIKYRTGVFGILLGDFDFRGKRVLDAMCGGGESTPYFLNRGAQVVGLDLSEKQCEYFRAKFPQCEVVCRSMLHSEFPDNSFDFIIIESLHHLPPHLEAGLQELTRILKTGGTLCIWEPSSGSLLDLARKIWYKLDNKYFEENECSIDLDRVSDTLRGKMTLNTYCYGGNLAHLFVQGSMLFRIPQPLVKVYAPLFLWLEPRIQRIQSRLFSCWVLATFKKDDVAH